MNRYGIKSSIRQLGLWIFGKKYRKRWVIRNPDGPIRSQRRRATRVAVRHIIRDYKKRKREGDKTTPLYKDPALTKDQMIALLKKRKRARRLTRRMG